jgi:hypothetical protein
MRGDIARRAPQNEKPCLHLEFRRIRSFYAKSKSFFIQPVTFRIHRTRAPALDRRGEDNKPEKALV